MSDDDRIDFSALDPARDARRWNALLTGTLERALPPQETVWSVIGQWRVGVLALAAVALLAWVPAWLQGPTPSQARTDPAMALVQYAHGGDVTALLESADVE